MNLSAAKNIQTSSTTHTGRTNLLEDSELSPIQSHGLTVFILTIIFLQLAFDRRQDAQELTYTYFPQEATTMHLPQIRPDPIQSSKRQRAL